MFKEKEIFYCCSFLLLGKCLFYPSSPQIRYFQVLGLNESVERLFPLREKNLVGGGVSFTILHHEIELVKGFEVVLEVLDKP
jgi:hypothetical protein